MDFDETYNINTKFKLFYMKNRALLFACVGILVCNGLIAKEYHVAKSGSDTNPGTVEAPFLLMRLSKNLKIWELSLIQVVAI